MTEDYQRTAASSKFKSTAGATETSAQIVVRGVALEISQTQGVWFGANKMFCRGATTDAARLSTVLSGRIILVAMTSHFVAG